MNKEEVKLKKHKKGGKAFSFFWKICLVLVILFVVGVSIAMIKLDSILKFSIEKAGTFVTQTPVTVDKIQLKILEGKLIIRNLAVANPPDYSIPHAMFIQEAFVFLDVKSLLSPEIHVKEVRLDGAEVSYVARGLTTNNISDIYQNIQRLIPAKDPSAPEQTAPEKEVTPDEKKAEKAGKKVIIDQVNITNTKFAFGMKFFGESSLDLSISDIHLKDLGKDKEMSTTEAIAQIFDEFFKGVNGVVNITGKMVKDTKKALKETSKALKNLFRKNKQADNHNENEIAPADAPVIVEPEQTNP